MSTIELTYLIATYNCQNRIKKIIDFIECVVDLPIQFVVSDGGSSDGTLTCFEATKNKNLVIAKSSPDEGIYDAWNKGLDFAKGQYIAFIGVDDIPGLSFISQTLNIIKSPEFSCPSLIYGNCIEYLGNLFRRKNHSEIDILNLINSGMLTFHHQGLLHSRLLFEKSNFSLDYKLASDLDFLIRKRHELTISSPLYLNEVQCYVEASGASRSCQAYQIYIKDYAAIQKNLDIVVTYNKKAFLALQYFRYFPKLFNFLVKLRWKLNSINEKIVIGA